VSIKSFPDYKHLLQENYVEYKHICIFFKCKSTQEVFLQHISTLPKAVLYDLSFRLGFTTVATDGNNYNEAVK